MNEFELEMVTIAGRIAAALEVIAMQGEAPGDMNAECAHPLDQRIDFGKTNGAPDWQCRVCDYRSLKVD